MKTIKLLAMLLLIGCASPHSTLMRSEGKVILIRGCEVCVSYDVVNMDWSNKSLGCFAHLNGHRYQVGDTYPDAAKHSTGKPMDCESIKWEAHPIDTLLSDGGHKFGGRKHQRKMNRRAKRLQRKNGIGLFVESQTGELA
jgi:hypothetical protein